MILISGYSRIGLYTSFVSLWLLHLAWVHLHGTFIHSSGDKWICYIKHTAGSTDGHKSRGTVWRFPLSEGINFPHVYHC